MHKILIYYPFPLNDEVNSGSRLRPLEMYKAFQHWGKNTETKIIIIAGESAQRERQLKQLVRSGDLDDVSFCYMENQTIPLWLTDKNHIPKRPLVDLKFMKFMKHKKIPVGIFYRDVYWKFEDLYPLKGLKKLIMQAIYRYEEDFYEKYCDVIFLPSKEMGKYVSINRKFVELPPGGKQREVIKQKVEGEVNGIYVGGINNETYGLFLLLDAIEIVQKDEPHFRLTVVCREGEFAKLSDEQKKRFTDLQVRVHHVSGEKLDELYQKMDFAFIPRLRSEYNDFSVPVKLVEYLSSHLPIVATDCTAQQRMLERDHYGIVCVDEKNSLAQATIKMIHEKEDYVYFIERTFINKHSWETRVEKIISTLSEDIL